MTTFHDFKAADINGAAIDLASYEGKVVLVVNTASKCGFTPQYDGLERAPRAVRRRRASSSSGFPCDQFGHQEPGDEAEIARVLRAELRRHLPDVRQDRRQRRRRPPALQVAQEREGRPARRRPIKWNFTKFLVGRDGQVIKRYALDHQARARSPADIEAALA